MTAGSGDVAALAWLDRTPDIYRRARPATPPRHLVSYAFLADPDGWP